MTDIDRRSFLRISTGALAGAAIGRVLPHAGVLINQATRETTGHPTGNASYISKIEQECQNSPDRQECIRNFEPTVLDKFIGIAVDPVIEEAVWRGVPSKDFMRDKDPIQTVFCGKGGFGMSRREIAVGLGSSIVFGAIHNLNIGINTLSVDTKRIPASQAFSGLIYWYLQRKFGIASNILAHSMNNFRVLVG